MKRLVEALEESDSLVDLRRLQAQRERQLSRLPCAETDRRIDRLLVNRLRILRRDLFNLHAAGLRSHKHQLARGAIEHDAEIQFAINVRGLFDQQPLHLLALWPGLMGHQLHAENVLGMQLGIFARLRHFHAAALAAASGVNLCLDHDTRARLRQTACALRPRPLQSSWPSSPLGTATPYLARISFA